jgi:putative ABC transport system permease protein
VTLVPLAVAIVALVAIAVAVSLRFGLGHHRDLVVVTVRAVVQLLLIAVVLRVILDRPALAPLYLTAMLAVAAHTTARRLRGVARAWPAAALAIGAGTTATAVVVFGTGALSLTAQNVVPFTAQLLGGAMTAATLAGARMRDDALAGWDVVEAALSLGATPRQALEEFGRAAAARSLVPALDQTRNVGLVVLPGAYVGLLLAGASPLDAGRVQLLVLIGLLTAESIAAVTITALLARPMGTLKPVLPGTR